MADQSNGAGSSSMPKVVPSLAKRTSDTTRGGAAKLKFVPTLPARRVKPDAKKEDAPAATTPTSSERGRGRGRGFDRGRGRGRGEPRPPQVEMTASGPFAMGPTLAGSSAWRTVPRTTVAPVPPPGGGPRLGAGLTPVVKREKKDEDEDDRAVYSDPDEGVEIVDMEDVKGMDWMAPENLAKEKVRRKQKGKGKGKGKEVKVKEEEVVVDLKGVAKEQPMDVDTPEPEVNAANALDLSESEEEEELEDIIDDFAEPHNIEEGADLQHERLYFFQFPQPFPQFTSPSQQAATAAEEAGDDGGAKKVTFAQDTKPPAPDASAKGKEKEKQENENVEPKVDGVIGQLEIYESGLVKMRLENGIVMDVTAATQPSFLQQAVYVDPENKRLCVLGEVNRRFVVSPDIEALLQTMELNEANQNQLDALGDNLIVMDTS